MEKNIYIRLLGEGAPVYRAVPATEIRENLYHLKGYNIYDPEEESWEFAPGALVVVEERKLSEGAGLVAIREHVTVGANHKDSN
jgi:hypothetical protein